MQFYKKKRYHLRFFISFFKKRYAFLYVIVYFVLIALDFSANLITMYLFYEFMTLCSMPLIIHDLKKESISAAMKYLYYSISI